MRIALFQQRHVDDAGANLHAAESAIRSAAQQGADLVCLQELFATAYFPRLESAANFDLAEPVPGPTTEQMGKLARELSLVLIVPLFERRAPGLYHNSAVVIDSDGTLAGHYRKMHLPDEPGFSEKFYFSPGDRGFFSVDTSVGRIAVLICWDQWFPEAARLVTTAGVTMVMCHGLSKDAVVRAAQGEAIGTLFRPAGEKLEARKRWMLADVSRHGQVTVDDGAVKALLQDHRSLLPAGIQGVRGEFQRGETIYVVDSASKRIACGIANYDAKDIAKIKGLRSGRIEETLGYHYGQEIVHRNNLVLL